MKRKHFLSFQYEGEQIIHVAHKTIFYKLNFYIALSSTWSPTPEINLIKVPYLLHFTTLSYLGMVHLMIP